MNKLGRGLLAGLLLISSAAQTALKNDRTFLAHREDISNVGMDWITQNHYQERGDHTNMGSSFTVTPFFAESTNHKDLARLFGMGTTSQVKVTGTTRPTRTNMHSALYSFNIDHSPNSDGATGGQVPMSGTASFKPQRRVWGAHLSYEHSLDTVLKGLRLAVRAPLTEVSTTMGATFPTKVASAIPAIDGGVADIDEYFKGDFSKAKSTTVTHVVQEGLNRQKFDGNWHKALAVGDVVATLKWNCYNARRFSFGVSASLQLPTGNMPTGEWLFEPISGGRGHTSVGLGANLHLKGLSKGALKVNFDVIADWKYGLKGTEKRTLGIYDTTNKVTLPGSSYRNLVKHLHAGVSPAANVMTVDTDVTPGHRFEGLVGMSATWCNWHLDVGYNVYLSEKEKVEPKAWTDDLFAIAHHRYSAYNAAKLGTHIIGGNYVDGTDPTAAPEQNPTGAGSYDDTRHPVTKHQNKIGANGDAWAAGGDAVDGAVAEDGINADDVYPPANFSMNGPIQSSGKTTSALPARSSFYNSNATGAAYDSDVPVGTPLVAAHYTASTDHDVTNTDIVTDMNTYVTGVDADVLGDGASGRSKPATLTPRYNTTTANALTEAQITHSVVGGLGYRFQGNYPVTASIGAQGEFQDSNHNSALEGWKVWMKFGVNF